MKIEVPRHQPVIVAGMARNGASVARRLKRLGCRCWALDWRGDQPGWKVGGVRRLRCPDPQQDLAAWTAFMQDLGSRFEDPPPLLPTTDEFVVAMEQTADQLQPHYRTHGFGRGLRAELTAKQTTFEHAQRAGVPCPRTQLVDSEEELSKFISDSSSPVLLKPDLPPSWRTGSIAELVAGRKVLTGDEEQLLAGYRQIAPWCSRVVAQEIIPGADDQLFYWCGFVGPEGRVGGRLVGRKRRIAPIHYGSATFVELTDQPELEELCERFLVSLGYCGLCGIEFKQDSRDGEFKLIEVNPRYGLWDDIGVPVGVDLAAEAAASLWGRETTVCRPRHSRQKWVELIRDVGSYRRYRRESLLTTGQWLRSLWPPIVVNDLSWRDPSYAWHMVWRQLGKRARLPRRVRRLKGGRSGGTD